ncbi:MAG: hypothetical protein HYV37_03145 [Candidatus Levyibacteriota bacterium]|nr:MAG: hypothetical protein HYV37_03145 [Candidatus Levybacteria bacterium]
MKGQSLVELLLAIAFAGIIIPVLFTGFLTSRDGKAQEAKRLLAIPLLKEAQEAARMVREKDWNTFSVNGTYHPVVSGNTWSFIAGTESINDFNRNLVVSDGADSSIKKVVATVSWSTPRASSVASTMYLSRYINNSVYIHTTANDFNAGTKTGVTVTNTSGGEVILGAGGNADWCAPNLSIAALDLPKSSAAKAITAVYGEAFAGTGQDSSGESLVDIFVSNTHPPAASINTTFDGYKTNDVFGEVGFAYIATDTNAKEVVIISTANKPFTEVGYFNAPGSEDGKSIFVSGNTGYLVQGNKLWNFDLSSKAGLRPAVDADGITLAGEGKAVYVVGNYAYVAIEDNSVQMQIIDISNLSNMVVVGQAIVNGEDGQDIFVNSSATRAYLVTKSSSSQRELFIIDVSTKSGNRPIIGSYDTNGMNPKGVEAVTNNKVIVVGENAEEYQVVNIQNETSPVRCGGLQINSGIFDSASVIEPDGDAFAYIVTGDSSAELKIIEGGPGGSFATSGTFESSTFDAINSVTFNRFIVSGDKPQQTNLTFQVSGADVNPLTGDCTDITFSFVGPDLTSNTYFATSSAIPLNTTGEYKNPARCFRYKSFLSTSDPTQSPALYDMTVNYSP